MKHLQKKFPSSSESIKEPFFQSWASNILLYWDSTFVESFWTPLLGPQIVPGQPLKPPPHPSDKYFQGQLLLKKHLLETLGLPFHSNLYSIRCCYSCELPKEGPWVCLSSSKWPSVWQPAEYINQAPRTPHWPQVRVNGIIIKSKRFCLHFPSRADFCINLQIHSDLFLWHCGWGSPPKIHLAWILQAFKSFCQLIWADFHEDRVQLAFQPPQLPMLCPLFLHSRPPPPTSGSGRILIEWHQYILVGLFFFSYYGCLKEWYEQTGTAEGWNRYGWKWLFIIFLSLSEHRTGKGEKELPD